MDGISSASYGITQVCTCAADVADGERDGAARMLACVTPCSTGAAELGRRGCIVDVELTSDDGVAVLIVENSGPEVPAADLPHLRTAFHRAGGLRVEVRIPVYAGESGQAACGHRIARA
jgi:hypothetical protein